MGMVLVCLFGVLWRIIVDWIGVIGRTAATLLQLKSLTSKPASFSKQFRAVPPRARESVSFSWME